MLWKSLTWTAILLSTLCSATLTGAQTCSCPPSTGTSSGIVSSSSSAASLPSGFSSAPTNTSSATGGTSLATGGTSLATGGTLSVTGGTSTATGGTSSAPTNTSSATGGTSPATGGTSSATGGTSSAPSGTSSVPTNTSQPPSSSTGAPTNGTAHNGTSSTNGTSSGPQFVIYSDKWVTGGLPDVTNVQGYTVFILSFLLSTGAADQAQGWAQLDSNTRKQLKSKYNEAGIKVIVSAFGGTETPTTSGVDATKIGTTMAQWVIDNDLDGIDVDYEDFAAMNAADGKAEEWLSTFTKTLRSKLSQGKYIVTHAPVAPWFATTGYKSGAYRTVHKNVGDMIDWYNIQFYNQNEYTDCNGLITKSSNTWPGTSLSEIAASGVEQSKLIIGKPATTADASNGYIDPDTLATCLQQAKAKGWSGGVMVWQYPNADAKWIETVRAKSWPVSS